MVGYLRLGTRLAAAIPPCLPSRSSHGTWGELSVLISCSEYLAYLAGIFAHNVSFLPQIVEMYPPLLGDNRLQLSQLLTDFLFACYARHMLRQMEQAGVASTYLYQFTHLPPVCLWPSNQLFCCNYVCHGDELIYVYWDSGPPYFPFNLTGSDESLASSMSHMWAAFAANPGAPISAAGIINFLRVLRFLRLGWTWPVYRTATDQNARLDWPLSTVSGLKAQACDLFDQVSFVTAWFCI